MGIIYLAQPIGNRVRSIDRLKPKDRKKPANCNNSNVKFGKHLSNYSDLKDRIKELSIYFASLTGFVASWIAGEKFKPEDEVNQNTKK